MLRAVLVILVFATAVYLCVWWVDQRRASLRRSRPAPGRGPTPPRRQIAPDDDPEFLRNLDRKRRKRDRPDG